MNVLGLSPNMQVVDPRTGRMTTEAFMFFSSLTQGYNGEAATATTDGIQTLTNKTIDGNSNTLSNIDTDSLETRTGEDEAVVTGTAGLSGFLAKWNGNGDLVDSGIDVNAVAQTETVMLLDGAQAMGAPLSLLSSTVAGVPAAADWTGSVIYVSNESGGATPAFSDGTNWRRFADRAIIS